MELQFMRPCLASVARRLNDRAPHICAACPPRAKLWMTFDSNPINFVQRELGNHPADGLRNSEQKHRGRAACHMPGNHQYVSGQVDGDRIPRHRLPPAGFTLCPSRQASPPFNILKAQIHQQDGYSRKSSPGIRIEAVQCRQSRIVCLRSRGGAHCENIEIAPVELSNHPEQSSSVGLQTLYPITCSPSAYVNRWSHGHTPRASVSLRETPSVVCLSFDELSSAM